MSYSTVPTTNGWKEKLPSTVRLHNSRILEHVEYVGSFTNFIFHVDAKIRKYYSWMSKAESKVTPTLLVSNATVVFSIAHVAPLILLPTIFPRYKSPLHHSSPALDRLNQANNSAPAKSTVEFTCKRVPRWWRKTSV